MHPADTLRARLDSYVLKASGSGQPIATSGLGNPLRSFVFVAGQTWRTEGIRGLYGGYGVQLLGSGPANALYFGGYKVCKRALSSESHGSQGVRDAVAGLGAELLSGLVWTPLDVVKQRLQVSPRGTTMAHVLSDVAQSSGVRGFYRGYWAGMQVWAPFSMVYFATYEVVKDTLNAKRSTARPPGATTGSTFDLNELLAGMAGGAAGALLTQPLDCRKTRLQVGQQELSTTIAALSSPTLPKAASFQSILREEGPAALMRGAAARVLWISPGCGITFFVFEAMQRALLDAS